MIRVLICEHKNHLTSTYGRHVLEWVPQWGYLGFLTCLTCISTRPYRRDSAYDKNNMKYDDDDTDAVFVQALLRGRGSRRPGVTGDGLNSIFV